MRYFSKPSSLDRLSLEARILYTGFCFFLLFGYASSGWLYHDDDLGTSRETAARYYLGGAEHVTAPHEISTSGPKIEMPDDRAAESLRLQKPARQVIETFHFHLFTVPVVLLIVGHLFMMSKLSTRTKAWVIGLASAATFVHMLLPLLIRFITPLIAGLMFPSAVVSAILWGVMTVVPVYEMWRKPTRARASLGEIDSASS
jgi:hypothetical protein